MLNSLSHRRRIFEDRRESGCSIWPIELDFETLERISGEVESGSGTALVGGLEDVKLRVRNVATIPEHRIGEIPAVAAKTRLLEAPLSSLRETIRAISLVAVPLRIEATDFNDSENSFDVFTSEVTRLATDASAALREFSRTYEALVERLEKARSSSESLSRRNALTARDVSMRIEASVANVARGADRMMEARREITQRFREFQGTLGTTVSAVQFGDIARQRIEHIEEGLALALKTLSDGAQTSTSVAEHAGVLSAICRLQSEQTRDTMIAFDAGAGDLVTLLGRLAESSHSILSEAAAIQDVVLETSKTVDGDVADALAEIGQLLGDTERQRRDLDEAFESVVATMSNLFGQLEPLREMRAAVHLLSINMALRSSQLGPKGRSIRAIAHELSQLSTNTVAQVSAVISLLQDAADHAHALVAKGEAAGEFDREVAAARGALEVAQRPQRLDSLDAAFSSLRQDGVEVSGLVQAAILKSQIQTEISKALGAAHDVLKDMRERLMSSGSAGERSELEAHELKALENLRKSYTMNSERHVHDRALGLEATPIAAEASDSLDDIFF